MKKLIKTNYSKENVIQALIYIYILFSGFVFIEPAPSDIIFILLTICSIFIVGYSIVDIIKILSLTLTVMIPFTFALNKYSMYNIKFTLIDMYLFLSIIVFTKILYTIFNKEKDMEYVIEKIMQLWAITGCINVLVSLIGYISGNYNILGSNVIWGSIRMKGFFKDANVLGPFLIVPSIYFIESMLLNKKNNIYKIIELIILNIGILWTFSRGAWISYIVAIGILFIKYLIINPTKSLNLLKIIFVAIIVVFLMAPYLKETELYNYFNSRLGIQSYDSDRFSNQGESIDMFIKSPIFGIGPGNYEAITAYSAHSAYARTISEKGIIGVLSLIIILGIPLYKGLRIKKVFLVASLISIYIGGIAVDTLHWRHLYIIISLILASYKYEKINRGNIWIKI